MQIVLYLYIYKYIIHINTHFQHSIKHQVNERSDYGIRPSHLDIRQRGPTSDLRFAKRYLMFQSSTVCGKSASQRPFEG